MGYPIGQRPFLQQINCMGEKKKSQGSKGKGIVPVFKRVLRYFKKNKWKAGSYLNLDLDKPTIKKVGE